MVLRSLLNLPMKSNGGTGGRGEGGRCLELTEAQPMHQPIIYCKLMQPPIPPKNGLV